MHFASLKIAVEMWVLAGENRVSALRFSENKSPGRIFLSDFCFVLLHVYRADPGFKKAKVSVSASANVDKQICTCPGVVLHLVRHLAV